MKFEFSKTGMEGKDFEIEIRGITVVSGMKQQALKHICNYIYSQPNVDLKKSFYINGDIELENIFIKRQKEILNFSLTDNEILNEINSVLKDELVDMNNISLDLERFFLVKGLILEKIITDNSFLIIKNPEDDTHPALQVKFMEIIAKLQKQYNMKILIITHSPYIVYAVETFSLKYNIENNYYLLDLKSGEGYILNDITDKIEDMYSSITKPFFELEDLETKLLKERGKE